MTVFTCTFVDQHFDKRSSEVQYLAGLLNQIAAGLQSQQGDAASGNVIGVAPSTNTPNSILASWVYSTSASLP